MRSPVIDEIEAKLRERAEELRPMVEEYEQIQRVLATFAEAASPTPHATRRRGASGGGRTSGRAAQALELVEQRPGITVAELADAMGIGPTYLYRLMPGLEREGKVSKNGTGYVTA